MAKKKSKQTPGDGAQVAPEVSSSTPAPAIPQVPGTSAGETKTNSKSPRVAPPGSPYPPLMLSRNK